MAEIARPIASTNAPRVRDSAFRRSQESFDLREGLLDGVEIGRVGWQVEELATSLLDQPPNPRTFVGREVVHDHHLPFQKRRSQHLLDIGLEDPARSEERRVGKECRSRWSPY